MTTPTTPRPTFTLDDQHGNPISLTQFIGQWIIVYFYPKDDTPGCTTEARDFAALSPADVTVIGISPDSTDCHQKFINKYSLPFTLLSDPDKEVMKSYGAWGMKKNYGREYEGVIRSTFIINPQGEIAHSWHNVKAKGHAARVIEKLAELRS